MAGFAATSGRIRPAPPRAEGREQDGAAEVAKYDPSGWDTAAINAGAHALAESLRDLRDDEGARKVYYTAYDRGARAAQKALSAE